MSSFNSYLDLLWKNQGERVAAAKLRFSAQKCFQSDSIDAPCLNALGEHLQSRKGRLGLFGSGQFFSDLADHAPEVIEKADCLIVDATVDKKNLVNSRGLPVITPNEIHTRGLDIVFLCETRTFPRMQMRRALPEGMEILCPDILPEIAWTAVPMRSWIANPFSIYPIDVPEIEFKKDQDLILLDVPARNLALMPNGLAYIYNALKTLDISCQVFDTDIIVYHRYHIRRIFDEGGTVFLSDGSEMPLDPWQAENYELWMKPEVLEHFRSHIDEITSKLIEAKPKVLGISIQQCNEAFAKEIVVKVKESLPDLSVVVGGFSCYNQDVGLKAFPEADYMCIQEAELTAGPLISALINGERPKNLPGIHSRYDDPEHSFIPAPLVHNLDTLDFPKYQWFDLNLYRNYNNYQLTPILASRGCRWSRCTFCAERFFWRVRSAKAFCDELEWLIDHGCNLFMFNESDLNGMPERLLEICDEIIRRKLPTKLAGQLRIHKKSDRAFFDKLHEAGFFALRFGIDALSDKTLKLQAKGYNMEIVSQNLKDCTNAGIYTEVNWVVGVPGETEEDIDEGIDFIIKHQDYIGRLANINMLCLANGSVYWLDPDAHNVKFRGDREEIYKEHPRALPEHLWYSEAPYIDADVRRERFRRIITRLNDAGFNVGAWASKVIEDTLHLQDEEANDKSASGQDQADVEDASEFSGAEKKTPLQVNSVVDVPVVEDLALQLRLIRHEGEIYGVKESDLKEIYGDSAIQVLENGDGPNGQFEVIWSEDADADPEFICAYGEFNLIKFKDYFYACPHGLVVSWPKVSKGIYPDVIERTSFNKIREEVIKIMAERGVNLRVSDDKKTAEEMALVG